MRASIDGRWLRARSRIGGFNAPPVGTTLVANAFARERAPTSRKSSAPCGSDLGRERLRASALPQVASRPRPVGATLVANAFARERAPTSRGPSAPCGNDLGRECLRARARSHKSRVVRALWERPWSNAFARERAPTSRESSAPRGSDLGREGPCCQAIRPSPDHPALGVREIALRQRTAPGRRRPCLPRAPLVGQASWPWQCLYFLPLPQGQGSLRPILAPSRTIGDCAPCW